MNDPSRQRLGELFEQALGLPASEREAWTRQACGGDEALAGEILSLLSCHDEAGDFLEQPLLEARGHTHRSHDTWSSEREEDGTPLESIGAFRILGELGRGGMGVVYRARQENPDREVALKVLPPGYASPRGLQRFQNEADVLARLDHRGIARIFEAGVAETYRGPRPYLALELIEGVRPTEYARTHALSWRERVGLLLEIVEAVQSAHEKAVLHRDLKPSNMLVTASGQPKVLDFGVARLMDDDAERLTDITRAGELIGTLPYMSPEQCGGDLSGVDVRSDVYALGVLGFQLIAGVLPFELKGQTSGELLAQLQQVAPRRLRDLCPAAPADLDVVIAKALARHPADRYPTARALADDLRAVLEHRSVSARPTRPWTKLARWSRRNPLAAMLCLGLLLAIGAAGSLGARLADRRAAEAETERRMRVESIVADGLRFLELAQIENSWETDGTDVSLSRAKETFSAALQMMPSHLEALTGLVLTQIMQGATEEAQDTIERHRQAIGETSSNHLLRYIRWAAGAAPSQESEETVPADPLGLVLESRRQLGRHTDYTDAAGWRRAYELATRAALRSSRPNRLACSQRVKSARRLLKAGQEGARKLFEEAVADLLHHWPDEFHSRYWEALALDAAGDHVSAEARLEAMLAEQRSATLWNALGDVQSRAKDHEAAIQSFREAITLAPEHAFPHYNLGNSYLALGRFVEAQAAFERAVQLSPNLSEAHLNLSAALIGRRQWEPALEAAKRSLEITPGSQAAAFQVGYVADRLGLEQQAIRYYLRSIEASPEAYRPRIQLAKILIQLDRPDEAEPYLDVAEEHVPNRAFRNDIAVTRARLEHTRGRHDRALQILDRDWKWLAKDPFARELRARILMETGDLEGAEQVYLSLRGDRPRDGAVAVGLAELYRRTGREAEREELLSGQMAVAPKDDFVREAFAELLVERGDAARLAEVLDGWEALNLKPLPRRALAVFLLREAPSVALPQPERALGNALRAAEACDQDDPEILETLALAHRMNGEPEMARRLAEEALARIEAGAIAPPGLEEQLRQLAR